MILAAFVTVSQLADLVTARHEYELNPIAEGLLSQPLGAFAAKVALVALVCAVMAICSAKYHNLSRVVALFAISAGIIGFLSNGGVS